MKNLVYLFVFAFMLVNCSADKTYEVVKDNATIAVVSAARVTSKSLFGGPIAAINQTSGKMSFLMDQKNILDSFNSALGNTDIDTKLTKLELDVNESNGNYYLRGYRGNYISTMLLVKDDSGHLQSAGITCSSTACAHNNGCEPKMNNTCSACSGTCKKTISSGGVEG